MELIFADLLIRWTGEVKLAGLGAAILPFKNAKKNMIKKQRYLTFSKNKISPAVL
jgi:hypothetical protein